MSDRQHSNGVSVDESSSESYCDERDSKRGEHEQSECDSHHEATRSDGGPVSEGNGTPSQEKRSDGGNRLQAHTVRLELVDEPGELLNALKPVAENGGNLLSVFHERGSLTPRGHIPVEIDLECPPDRFSAIVSGLRETGVNVIQAGEERYSEELALVLVGHIIEQDLSDTLAKIECCGNATVVDFSLSAPEGTDEESSARLRLAVEENEIDTAIESVRKLARQKNLRVVEPLTELGSEVNA